MRFDVELQMQHEHLHELAREAEQARLLNSRSRQKGGLRTHLSQQLQKLTHYILQD